MTRWSVEQLLDVAEITDALARYCRAMDRLDAPALGSVFHADAVIDHGLYQTSGAGLADLLGAAKPDRRISQHQVANLVVEFGQGETRSECYVTTVSRRVDHGSIWDLLTGGRYLDVWTRRSGELRILRRQLVWDLVRYDEVGREWPGSELNSDPIGAGPPTERLSWGSPTQQDPSHRFFAGQARSDDDVGESLRPPRG